MDFLDTLFSQILDYISLGYLCTFIALSYGLRGFVAEAVWAMIPSKWNVKIKSLRVYAVFLIALLIAIVWYSVTDESLIKLMVTYAVGTSFYELIIQKLLSFVKTKKEEPAFKDLHD